MGPTSELPGDLEQCALSLDLSVLNSNMRRLDPSPPGSFLSREAILMGEERVLGLLGREPEQEEKLGVGGTFSSWKQRAFPRTWSADWPE